MYNNTSIFKHLAESQQQIFETPNHLSLFFVLNTVYVFLSLLRIHVSGQIYLVNCINVSSKRFFLVFLNYLFFLDYQSKLFI